MHNKKEKLSDINPNIDPPLLIPPPPLPDFQTFLNPCLGI